MELSDCSANQSIHYDLCTCMVTMAGIVCLGIWWYSCSRLKEITSFDLVEACMEEKRPCLHRLLRFEFALHPEFLGKFITTVIYEECYSCITKNEIIK